ncbi:MAG TPA: hypothetical protein PLZ36_01495 [Armatimonadota bacterium]|nr:hypothetical protein [Armatimonadota bacterium]
MIVPLDTACAARTRQYCAAAAAAARTWYDDAGQWQLASKPPETRERLWLACALYTAGEAALADAVIRPGETARYGDTRFNIFDTNIAAALLVQFGDRMAADVRAKLEGLTRDGFAFKPGNRQPDFQFHGYNDNMPAKASLGLILGGEWLGDAEAVAYGVWNLRQFRALLVRCGVNSEFNSPTYTPLTMHAIAEIAEHARDAEARRLARHIEARLWIDLAARFHPEMGVVAGPYSRAYTMDTLAHMSSVSTLLWLVLGDRVHPSPMALFTRPAGLVVHHLGDYPYSIAQMSWLATGSYHVPEQARELFAGKSYPYRAVASAELGDYGADFPGRVTRLESVLDADYTLGTCTTPFAGGEQTLSYVVTYKRREPVASFRDVGTVFAKMVLDDDGPGTEKQAMEVPHAGAEWHEGAHTLEPIRYANAGEEDLLPSCGHAFALQDGPTALVLTHPHLALGGPEDPASGGEARPISRLSELVIFPSHFGGADEIIVGGAPRAAWSDAIAHGDWIACRRGRLLIAIRPLAYTRTLGPARLTLERINHYEVIRATFYDGEPRTFTRTELRHVFGGFLAEHASVDDYPSLAAFAADMAQGQFTDYYWATRRVRYRRPAGSARPALEMETSISPGAPTQRIAAINGRRLDLPVAAYDGIRTAELPFLYEPFTSVPTFFPWQDFSVAWGDWPFAIGDREQ